MTDKAKVFAAVAGLALAGVFVMLLATRSGIGVPPDSTVYFDAARNLGEGRGLVVNDGAGSEPLALTHYPPLYSSLVALASLSGANVETASRWLNAILFGANILLVGISIASCVRSSFWLPVIGSFLTLTAPDVLAMHSVAMTEPLYLALTFSGFLFLGSYLQNPRRRFLLAGAILISLSFLTRYVSVASVMTGGVALLLLEHNKGEQVWLRISFGGELLRRKVLDALLFAAISCGPAVLWSIRNHLATGGASDRQIAFHPVKPQQIVSAFSTAAQWLLLGKVRLDVRFIAFCIEVVALTSLTIYLIKARRLNTGSGAARTRLPHLLAIFVIVYLSFLVFTITFVETDIVLDSRSLIPVHFALLIWAPSVAGALYHRAQELRSIRIAFVVLALLLVGSYTFRGARWLAFAQADERGYAGRAWKESPAVAQIRRLPSEIPIYTNGGDAIYYLTGRRTFDIPAKVIRGTGRPNERYRAELQNMSDDMRKRHGLLVYFKTLPERWFLPLESELKSELPLTEVVTAPDGSIYELNLNTRSQPGP